MIKECASLLKILKKNRFIVILLLIIFVLRLPSLFEPYWYGDEGVYLTIGLAIKKGFLLYRDIYDNKTPLLYLLSALADGSLFWLKFFLLSSILVTIYFFYRLSQNLLIKEKAARIATIVFAILTTVRLLEGNIANAEMFILLPTVAGFSLFFSSHKKLTCFSIVAWGLILGLGVLFKVPAVFDFAVLLTFLVLFKEKDKIINLGKTEIYLTLGYLLPIFVTAGFFWLKGAFAPFFKACFLQTMGYLSSWQTGSHALSFRSLMQTNLFLKGFFVLIILSFLWLKRRKLKPTILLLLIWFAFSLFAATLSGRPYAHYLLQILPPLSLLAGWLFAEESKKIYRWVIVLVGALVFFFICSRFWTYSTLSYYQNFLEFTLGQKDKKAYFSFFNPSLPKVYSLAEFVAAQTKPTEKIFIWGDEPYLYTLARRLPATPYVVAYHIREQNLFNSIAQEIMKKKPVVIVIDKNQPRFSELETITQEQYLPLTSFDNYVVYRRRISL